VSCRINSLAFVAIKMGRRSSSCRMRVNLSGNARSFCLCPEGAIGLSQGF
jgi:hypothetical protein